MSYEEKVNVTTGYGVNKKYSFTKLHILHGLACKVCNIKGNN